MVQVGQEECPLLPTEDLLLFRIDSKRIKKDRSHWKQGHSNSIPLVIKNRREQNLCLKKKRKMADISQVNREKMSREYSKEEVARMMNEIMENN